MYAALLLSTLVVIPVYVMTILIAVRYRATNHKARYTPDWDNNNRLELVWWGIPMVIIGVLSVITWTSSHSLDPYRPIASSHKAIEVQVVALDWKWLFIYPGSRIATVNQVVMPQGVPVDFNLTSDTVMNSFWIPQLGGQIYAMPGMSTQLYLEADKLGSFSGSPANISGAGFSRMMFTAKSVTPQQFTQFILTAQRQRNPLTTASYAQL